VTVSEDEDQGGKAPHICWAVIETLIDREQISQDGEQEQREICGPTSFKEPFAWYWWSYQGPLRRE
jgi:hypothetical protein